MTDIFSAFKSDPDVKIELDMCSCCLNSGKLTNMQEDFENDGRVESYFNVLNRCYNDKILDSSSPLEKYYICDLCVQRLMDSYLFKCQVIKAQETVLKILKESEFNKDGDAKLSPTVFASYQDADVDIDKESIKSDWDDILYEPVKVKSERPRPAKRRSSVLTKAKSKTPVAKKGTKSKSTPAKASPPSKTAPRGAKSDKPKKAKQMSVKQSRDVKQLSKPAGKTNKELKAEICAAMDLKNKLCLMCGKVFLNAHMLKCHMNEHFVNYTCEECGKGFATQTRCHAHAKNHERGVFKCKHCDRIMDTYGAMKNHMIIHTKITYRCPQCRITFRSFHARQKHLYTEHGENNKRECQYCDYVTYTTGGLGLHVQKHHTIRDRSHGCPDCDKEFFDIRALKRHEVVHTGEKNFECIMCNRMFARKKGLQEHMKIHMNIRNYKCGFCGQAFVQNCSLKAHLRKHEKEMTPQMIKI